MWLKVKSCVLAARLTEHEDSGLARQSPGGRLAFAAVHQAVIHLHAVDAEGAVGEQRETGVLGGQKKKAAEKGDLNAFEKKVDATVSAD